MPAVPTKQLPIEKIGFMSAEDAMEALGISSRSYMDWLVINGKLTGWKIGSDRKYGGARVYKISEIEAYLVDHPRKDRHRQKKETEAAE